MTEQSVRLYEPTHADVQRVAEVLQAAVLRLIPATYPPAPHVPRASALNGSIAVVGLRSGMADELALVGTLVEAGYDVIAHSDAAAHWPLQARSELLLAGALQLLDSQQADFSVALPRLLEQRVAQRIARHRELERAIVLGRSLGIVGTSAGLLQVLMHAVRFGPVSEVPVLIQGETGTGKELVARALHRLDPKRCGQAFVAVNCAAINPNVAESEFFGHRRGAFTGADRHRKGLIPSADGGVLFLDEVGELDLELQAKLLRVLQEGRVLGVGEDRDRPVDVRIVAATNRDLLREVKSGRFRSDLYYRLSALLIRVPALHERKEDLLPLVEHFCEKHRALRATPLTIGADFLEALRGVHFDGNVRQLENLIRELMLQKPDAEPLHMSDLPGDLLRELRRVPAASAAPLDPWLSLFEQHGWQLERCHDACERMLLDAALRRARGNQSEAARLLGVTPRTIYNKLRKHHLAG